MSLLNGHPIMSMFHGHPSSLSLIVDTLAYICYMVTRLCPYFMDNLAVCLSLWTLLPIFVKGSPDLCPFHGHPSILSIIVDISWTP